MNNAKNLYVISNIVKAILEQDEQSRNSDSFLYLNVLRIIGSRNGIDINKMSITTFLLNMNKYGFPKFESVRRSRQKIQAEHPELAANSQVESHRKMNERVYRDYAHSKKIKVGE